MSQEKKPGTGAIFKNERKESENHPDYRGVIISPNGEEMQVALWLKTAQTTGKKYFSVAVSTPYRERDVVGATSTIAGITSNISQCVPLMQSDIVAAEYIDDGLPF